MSFILFIKRAGLIASLGQYYIDVIIEEGCVNGHEVGYVHGSPERDVTFRSVALVGGSDLSQRVVTIAINKPAFPIEELIGCRLTSSAASSQ